ncbi:MAG: hypothetical protein HQM16_16840 [Deltaproteobacteria bacterium]|nr:hypothetical protein [Deltaproteobacteria bacterium]
MQKLMPKRVEKTFQGSMSIQNSVRQICYDEHCFAPPETLDQKLAERLDVNKDGVITNWSLINSPLLTPTTGPGDVTPTNRDEYEGLIVDKYYQHLLPEQQKKLQLRVDSSFAARLQKPVSELEAKYRSALAGVRTRIEAVLGLPVPDHVWQGITVRYQNYNTAPYRVTGGNNSDAVRGLMMGNHEDGHFDVRIFNDDKNTLGHEIMHAVIEGLIVASDPTCGPKQNPMPLWFREGIADYANPDHDAELNSHVSSISALKERIPASDGFQNHIESTTNLPANIQDRFEGYLAVQFIADFFGEDALRHLLALIIENREPFETNFYHATQMTHPDFETLANQYLQHRIQINHEHDSAGKLTAESLWLDGQKRWHKTFTNNTATAIERFTHGGGLVIGITFQLKPSPPQPK